MQRREFIKIVGLIAAAWPRAVCAQQVTMPVIGYLYAGESRSNSNLVAAFRKGLSETGFVEGKNVVIEFRWAENH
jgi:putative ABC transport system substrate-binding protein